MKGIASKAFIAVSAIGIGEALYHAYSENAFTTNLSNVHNVPYSSFFGVPYWLFGVVWFPLVFAVALWATNFGRKDLSKELLLFLTLGNVFTAYLWYLDIVIVRSYEFVYIALYATNYLLTAFVVAQNWKSDVMHGYVYGTITGAAVGLLFGPYGVAACGIGGGIFGALRNYFMPKRSTQRDDQKEKSYLEEERAELQRRLEEIEETIGRSRN
jgi:uncharacterized membrane protein